jgi:hypothetical protein
MLFSKSRRILVLGGVCFLTAGGLNYKSKDYPNFLNNIYKDYFKTLSYEKIKGRMYYVYTGDQKHLKSSKSSK